MSISLRKLGNKLQHTLISYQVYEGKPEKEPQKIKGWVLYLG